MAMYNDNTQKVKAAKVALSAVKTKVELSHDQKMLVIKKAREALSNGKRG